MKQSLGYIDVRNQQLAIPDYPEGSVAELYSFGTILTGESVQRSTRVETKLASYMGYSAALLGLLAAGSVNQPVPGLIKATLLLATVATILAMLTSAIALRSRTTSVPSEPDWFREEVLLDQIKLRQYHVISLLLWHQNQQSLNVERSGKVRLAEILLLIGASLAGLVVILRLL